MFPSIINIGRIKENFSESLYKIDFFLTDQKSKIFNTNHLLFNLSISKNFPISQQSSEKHPYLSFPVEGKDDPKRFGKGRAREGNSLPSKSFSFLHIAINLFFSKDFSFSYRI